MKTRGVAQAVLAALALSAVPAHAWADTVPVDPVAAARLLGADGVKLAAAGDCSAAVDKLARAEAIAHAPITAIALGECEVKLGNVLAGTAILNDVVHEALPANAPQASTAAKQRAHVLLDAASLKIARLRIHVDRPPDTKGDPELTLDGVRVDVLLMDSDLPSDPRAHHVQVAQSGFTTASTDVTLGEGESKTVSLRLHRAPVAPTSPPRPSHWHDDKTAATPPLPTAFDRVRIPFSVASVAGVGGLLAGTIFGSMALGDKAKLDTSCVSKACPATSRSDIEGMHRDALVSSIAFGVGVIAVGAAVILGMLHGGDAPLAPKATGMRRSLGPTLRPFIGLGAAGLNGSFQ